MLVPLDELLMFTRVIMMWQTVLFLARGAISTGQEVWPPAAL